MRVNSGAAAVALVTLLLIVSAGLAAATIMDTYAVGPGPGVGDDIQQNGLDGDGPTDAADDSQTDAMTGEGGEQQPDLIPRICIEALENNLVVAGIVAFILGATALTYMRIGFTASMFIFYILGLPALLAYGVLTQCGPPGAAGDQGGLDQVLAETLGGAGGAVTTVQPPLSVVVGITVLFALVAVAALISATGSQEFEAMDDEQYAEAADLEQFAEAAGRAADRIEKYDADVDNAVYEAWNEMTQLLNVENPATTSPREFAGEAIDIGMHEDDVDRLTTLFEEVRYGHMDPEPREELAIDTLRTIQENYSPDDVADDVPADEGEGEEDV